MQASSAALPGGLPVSVTSQGTPLPTAPSSFTRAGLGLLDSSSSEDGSPSPTAGHARYLNTTVQPPASAALPVGTAQHPGLPLAQSVPIATAAGASAAQRGVPASRSMTAAANSLGDVSGRAPPATGASLLRSIATPSEMLRERDAMIAELRDSVADLQRQLETQEAVRPTAACWLHAARLLPARRVY